jgi:hypothetical protein
VIFHKNNGAVPYYVSLFFEKVVVKGDGLNVLLREIRILNQKSSSTAKNIKTEYFSDTILRLVG